MCQMCSYGQLFWPNRASTVHAEICVSILASYGAAKYIDRFMIIILHIPPTRVEFNLELVQSGIV